VVGGGQADFAQNYADLNLMETISGQGPDYYISYNSMVVQS